MPISCLPQCLHSGKKLFFALIALLEKLVFQHFSFWHPGNTSDILGRPLLNQIKPMESWKEKSASFGAIRNHKKQGELSSLINPY